MVFRRFVAACAIGVALLLGSSAVVAHAESASSASPTASTQKATASGDEPDFGDAPDVMPDNSRLLWILGGAALVAVVAGAVVIIKR